MMCSLRNNLSCFVNSAGCHEQTIYNRFTSLHSCVRIMSKPIIQAGANIYPGWENPKTTRHIHWLPQRLCLQCFKYRLNPPALFASEARRPDRWSPTVLFSVMKVQDQSLEQQLCPRESYTSSSRFVRTEIHLNVPLTVYLQQCFLPLTNIWQHYATPAMQLEFRLIRHYSNCWIFCRREERDRQIARGVIRSSQLKWRCWNKGGKAALIFRINYGLIEGILCCTPL